MAILLGTTGEGETLPVLVDQFGNLLAKGIEGQQGTPGEDGKPGEEGPPGKDGGSFPLPEDPYEGAFLGWLNNELAWIGTPPVPIAEGVFGPITGWDSAGLLTVEGDIPSQIAQGVFVYQCNEDGSIYVDGWNNSKVWSEGVDNDGGGFLRPPTFIFDGTEENCATVTVGTNAFISVSELGNITTNDNLEVLLTDSSGELWEVSGTNITTTNYEGKVWNKIATTGTITGFRVSSIKGNLRSNIAELRLNGQILVDGGEYPTAPNLNLRVQSVNGQNLVGAPNRTDNFTIGKYLRVPEQNVARWLYDGNLTKVITSTGIDISRLNGN